MLDIICHKLPGRPISWTIFLQDIAEPHPDKTILPDHRTVAAPGWRRAGRGMESMRKRCS